MTKSIQPGIKIICGPTASGKSALALDVAEKQGGVIINADSQQMYREFSILTARPTPEEEARAPHKLYGTMSVAESCSAGRWLAFARMEIDWALAQGKLPIVTGGTGLYIKALMEGIAEIPEIDPIVRAQADGDYDAMGKDAFAERLKAADPEFFARLKVYDRQRLVRAYSVWLGTGKSLSWWQARGAQPAYSKDQFDVQVVEIDRAELYRRCDARFVKMLEEGAIEEVKSISGLQSPVADKIIGVPELSAHIRGEIPLDEAVRKAQQATRNYAKRQLTWFRNQLNQ